MLYTLHSIGYNLSKKLSLFNRSVLNPTKTLQLTHICFPEIIAACLEFLIFPAMFLLHLPLGQQEFTTSNSVTPNALILVIHQAQQSYWKVAVVLPVA